MDLREEAKRLFLEERLSPAQIAERLNIPAGTIRGWKSKEKWSGTFQCSEQNPARDTKPGCRPPFQPKNQLAMLHGLFARYLPDETRDIVQQIQDRGPVDVLWDQIQLAYAALLRSQKIMHVKDNEDHSTTKFGESSGQTDSEKWEIQYAWDKQASFLNAQAKAQTALMNMIKQYDELQRSGLVTAEQEARIAKLKSDMEVNRRRLEIDLVKAENASGGTGDESPDDGFVGAMNDTAAEVWGDGPEED